jgi:NDP-sugar pyrophosphorylase family protein
VKAGLLAAGYGARLREAGIRTPKPLVRIGGEPLVDRVLGAVAAAGIEEIACIFNEDADEVEAHCRRASHGIRMHIVRRTTPRSMESLFTLAPLFTDERFLVLTVDAVFDPATLRDFLTGAARHADAEGVLATTSFVADEKPLRIVVDADGQVTALGHEATRSPLVTAGFYVFHSRIFAEVDRARRLELRALREWLGLLLRRGYRLYGVPVAKTVDVDRPQDIVIAEAFVRNGFSS